MRIAFAFCLAVTLLAPIASIGADRKESSRPWIATAGIIRNGGQSGSGVPEFGIDHHRCPPDCRRCRDEREHVGAVCEMIINENVVRAYFSLSADETMSSRLHAARPGPNIAPV
jgi:hypothetical protein